jgi:hypothetical protein
VADEQAEPERERELLMAALPDAEDEGGLLLVQVLTGLAHSEINTGDIDAAGLRAARALEIAERVRHPVGLRQARLVSGVVACQLGDYEDMLRHNEAALASMIEIGDLEGQMTAEVNCGVSHHLIGDRSRDMESYLAASAHYERANELGRRLGLESRTAMNDANLGQVCVRLGDFGAAKVKLLNSMRTAMASGARSTLLYCLLLEADRRLTMGDREAVRFLGLVRVQPGASLDTEREISTILSRTVIADDELERLLAEGADLDLDATVEAVVQELEDATG